MGVDLSGTAEGGSDQLTRDHLETNHVGTAALACPVEESSTGFCWKSPCEASLRRTAGGGCPHVVLLAADDRFRRTHVVETIVDSHHDHVLGRHVLAFRRTPGRRHGYLKVITRCF